MKKKRIIIIAIIILLVLFISDILYLVSFNLNAYDERFYSKEFTKYDVYGEFPGKDIDRINSELLLYIKGKKDEYNTELFNDNEIEHMEDVRDLIHGLNIYYYFAMVFCVLLFVALFFLNKKRFFKNVAAVLFFSGAFSLVFVILLLVWVWIDFSSIFTVFHRAFFPQGGWMFAASDNIIKLYPSGLFYDIAKKIFISVVFYGNILILGGILLFWKND